MDQPLYDLIAQESAKAGRPREQLLVATLQGIAESRLQARSIDGQALDLDAPFPQGKCWRGLLREAVAAVERNPFFYARWFHSIAVAPADLRRLVGEDPKLPCRPGRRPKQRLEAKEKMRDALANGLSRHQLRDMPVKELAGRFGPSETTCRRAREAVLQEEPG
jgi:hypothetical protein